MKKSILKQKINKYPPVECLLQLSAFFNKFGELIAADVPLLRAMDIALTLFTDTKTQNDFKQMKTKMEQGQSIIDTFREYPQYCSKFNLAIIESGEREGRLEEGLVKVAQSLQKEITAADFCQMENDIFAIPISKQFNPTQQLALLNQELSKISSHLSEISRQLTRISHSNSIKKKKGKIKK